MLASPSQQGTASSPFFLSSEDSYRFHVCQDGGDHNRDDDDCQEDDDDRNEGSLLVLLCNLGKDGNDDGGDEDGNDGDNDK